jgi:hypothetical protein
MEKYVTLTLHELALAVRAEGKNINTLLAKSCKQMIEYIPRDKYVELESKKYGPGATIIPETEYDDVSRYAKHAK